MFAKPQSSHNPTDAAAALVVPGQPCPSQKRLHCRSPSFAAEVVVVDLSARGVLLPYSHRTSVVPWRGRPQSSQSAAYVLLPLNPPPFPWPSPDNHPPQPVWVAVSSHCFAPSKPIGWFVSIVVSPWSPPWWAPDVDALIYCVPLPVVRRVLASYSPLALESRQATIVCVVVGMRHTCGST